MRLVGERKITPMTRVWRDGMADWLERWGETLSNRFGIGS